MQKNMLPDSLRGWQDLVRISGAFLFVCFLMNGGSLNVFINSKE